MSPQERHDEEGGDISGHDGQDEQCHDIDSDDDATLSADAPMRPQHYPQRPSVDFDGLHLGGGFRSSWWDAVADRIPPRVKQAWDATVIWVEGPNPPRVFSITPFFPNIQHAPIALLDRYAPKSIHRFWILILLYASWLFAFSMVLRASSFSASIPGYGNPVRLGCTSRYWSEGNGCGLNGDRCRPFSNATLAFRCPADCHKAEILNPHAVGDQEAVYRALVVGGPTEQQTGFEDEVVENAVYRGDSFICASAIHAGFIPASEGGCGVLTLTGEQSSFTESKHHGISSLGFDTYFPHSFAFLRGTRADCKDLRWPALAVSVFFTTLLSLFTTSPAVFFWSTFVCLFFHVALASDPPSLTTYYALLSVAFGRFLPACFCAWVTYRYIVKRSLTGLTAQIEKTVLWLGPAWTGALNNYTFDRIPIQRLTAHDIQAQPGAIPALVSIVLIIFFIALGQAWAFRVEGRMPRYLAVYGLMLLALMIMLAIPGLDLRIHHYILALLLLPGTSFQNRPSLIYQGLLMGLFINGIARWGFDSILQTPGELFTGVQQGSLLPTVSVLAIHGVKNVTFNLGQLPHYDADTGRIYDGISVLVNDVERFHGYEDDRGYWDDGYATGRGNLSWTWRRHRFGRDLAIEGGQDDDNAEEESAAAAVLPEYFRFAYSAGSDTADYTKAGRWDSDGSWIAMEPGPS